MARAKSGNGCLLVHFLATVGTEATKHSIMSAWLVNVDKLDPGHG